MFVEQPLASPGSAKKQVSIWKGLNVLLDFKAQINCEQQICIYFGFSKIEAMCLVWLIQGVPGRTVPGV